MAVPKLVSDRMARRMALFCGANCLVWQLVSYLIVNHGWLKCPTAVVLLSMAFGLGC